MRKQPPETQACGLRDSSSRGFIAGDGELMEEGQALADISEGETDSLRPGEDDGDSTREDSREYGRDDYRYDTTDQGEHARAGAGGRCTLGRALGFSCLCPRPPWTVPGTGTRSQGLAEDLHGAVGMLLSQALRQTP